MQPITPSVARTNPAPPTTDRRAPLNIRAAADDIALLLLVVSLAGMLVSLVLLVLR